MEKKQKKLLIAANWKMTPATVQDAKKKALSFKTISKKYQKTAKSPVQIQVLVCPPYPYISDLKRIFNQGPAMVGAQDVSQHDGGSKTGEVASTMIHSFGAAYTIVGHSERRAQGDTDEVVAVKLGQVLRTKMNAILCIGEKERDNDAQYLEEIKRQLKASLARVSNNDFAKIVIAYEPVWAIGRTDNIALSGHELHQMVIYIRKALKELYNESIASSVKILYGGSVTPENTEDIIWNGEVDGLLIGRASFEPKSYEEICKAIIAPTIEESSKVSHRQNIKHIKRSITLKKKNDSQKQSNKQPKRTYATSNKKSAKSKSKRSGR